MAAVGASLCLKLAPETVRRGIEGMQGVPGRMERVAAGQPFRIIVDYAHTPDALENMLATVRALPHGRLITVFGCGGDRDRGKRPLMGEIAARMSDLVIATSDNPRSEDPLAILAEIEAGLRKGPSVYEMVVNRREAIELAIKSAQAGDVIVIAGKGHENYQIIGTRVYPFDDRAVARELIKKLPNARAVRY
jgi:UDP-N-acetylmuramoyl-L-alanyl-D-glutamate--2,6-diaminopimelate ligase